MRTILAAMLMMVGTGNAWAQNAPPAAPSGSASSSSTPPTTATGTARPVVPGTEFLPHGGTGMLPHAGSSCNCCPGSKKRGSLCHVLLEWATYCPKERIGICKTCNTCKYKGALPFYPFFGRGCQEGSGVHPTLPPDYSCHCHQGCSRCGAGQCK